MSNTKYDTEGKKVARFCVVKYIILIITLLFTGGAFMLSRIYNSVNIFWITWLVVAFLSIVCNIIWYEINYNLDIIPQEIINTKECPISAKTQNNFSNTRSVKSDSFIPLKDSLSYIQNKNNNKEENPYKNVFGIDVFCPSNMQLSYQTQIEIIIKILEKFPKSENIIYDLNNFKHNF